MKKFIYNIKKYYKYAIYSAKAELKAEVATSYLNWIWWILDPICFMLIYTFITKVVFSSNEQNIQVFVFIGLTSWNFFNKMLTSSVKLISANKSIITKTYIPKYIILLSKSFTLVFKTMISFALVIVLMLFFGVGFSLNILWFPLIFIVLYVLTMGMCLILMHFGIFVEDLSNVTNILLKLVFYLSGIFYNIQTRVPAPYNKLLLNLNPAAFFGDEFRRIFLSGIMPNFKMLALWLVVGLILSYIGIRTIHKYENSYAKVI